MILRRLPAAESIRSFADAEPFLDVNLGVDRGWYDAVGRMSLYRISEFKQRYEGLMRAIIASADQPQQTHKEVIALFEREAGLIARALYRQAELYRSDEKSWVDADYGAGQLGRATKGEAMRFDKAVITVIALNKIAAHCGLDDEWAIGPNQIVACAFYYANLRGRLLKLGQRKGDNDQERLEAAINEVSDLTGQPAGVIKLLAGGTPTSETDSAYEAAATTLASFPTQYSIYLYLQKHVPEIGRRKLEEIIVRRRVQSHKMKMHKDEVYMPAGRVNHGPYAWPRIIGDNGGFWPSRTIPTSDDPQEPEGSGK